MIHFSNRFSNKDIPIHFTFLLRDAWIISLADTGTSMLAGCTIFGILGNLQYETNADDISKVVNAGTGLAFVSYPTAIAKFDWFPQVKQSFSNIDL